jgi:guanylate kinase
LHYSTKKNKKNFSALQFIETKRKKAVEKRKKERKKPLTDGLATEMRVGPRSFASTDDFQPIVTQADFSTCTLTSHLMNEVLSVHLPTVKDSINQINKKINGSLQWLVQIKVLNKSISTNESLVA